MISGCNPKGLPFIKEYLRKNDELNTKQTNEDIKTNAKLKELDDLCKSIPLPDSFKFYGKQRSYKHSNLLSFYYYSEDSFDKSDKHFREYFLSNGWKLFEENYVNRITELRKDDKAITIQYGGIGIDANYSFACKRIVDAKD
ncbi:MAG: hypothetical protein MUC29_05195 [Pyrinomonadaceae bacterium]|jgi:hypothetical protein|nr:hypothetical protein [Pyrinomonadaceae bacterium]